MNNKLRGFMAGLSLMAAVSTAHAEAEFTFYGGIQEAPHSSASVSGGSVNQSLGIKWQGKSFESPPYYGLRYTRWIDQNWGWALNFTHAKVYASDATRTREGFSILEMTDGLNPLTLNAMYRASKPWGSFQPYGGVGVGISLPHVELQKEGVAAKTFEYQYGGPVLGVIAGLKYPLNDKWSLIAEYHFHYYALDVKMKPDNRFKSDIITNAFNFGAAYRW